MSQNPKASASVVVTARNLQDVVGSAVDSALAQVPPPREVITVDDGSTDATASVLARYGSRICYVKTDGIGAPAARNTGWRTAISEYVECLDGDDWWLPGKLQQSMAGLSTSDAPMVHSDVMRVGPDGTPVEPWSKSAPTVSGRILLQILMNNPIQTSSVVLRRSVLDMTGGFDESLVAWEDIDLWTRIAVEYPIASLSEVLACYRMIPSSLSSNITAMAESRLVSVVNVLESDVGGVLQVHERRNVLANAHLYRAVAYYLTGEPNAARSSLLRAAIVSPVVLQGSRWWSVFVKSLLGERLLRELRAMRRGSS